MRLALIALACGCAASVPPVPGRGGPAWTEVTSEHFTLWTDAGAERGRELVRQMEHLRQVVLGMAFPTAADTGKSLVIAMRDEYEVRSYIPEPFIAYAVIPGDGNPVRQPMIVFAADTNESDGHVIVHELTHVISHGAIHHQPKWFAEGLARFFESVRLDSDRAVVDVGEPLDVMVRGLRFRRLLTTNELFGCKDAACMDDRFYTTAWAVFSYLTNVHPTELAAYEHRLDELPDDPQRAWTESFPELTPGKLDQEVRAWLTQGQHTIWHYRVALQPLHVDQRSLGDADVYAARALVGAIFYRHDKQTTADISSALAVDPLNVLAYVVRVTIDRAAAPASARQIAAAHPDDWRAWFLVTLIATGDEQAAAREKACTLVVRERSVEPPRGLCP